MTTPFRLFLLLLLLFFRQTARSQDFWEQLNGPNGIQEISEIAYDTAGRLFLLHQAGVGCSTDQGHTWPDCSAGVSAAFNTHAHLVPSPTGSMYLFSDFTNTNALLRYSADWNAWIALTVPVGQAYLKQMNINPQGRIWLGAGQEFNKLFYSDDEGQSYQQLVLNIPNSGSFNGLCTFNDLHNLIAVAYNSTQKVYHFTSTGVVTTVLTLTAGQAIYLGYNPHTGTAFFSDANGFKRSADGGLSWQDIEIDPGNPYQPSVNAVFYGTNGDTWATGNNAVYYSSDDGQTWTLYFQVTGSYFESNKFFRTATNEWLRAFKCALLRTEDGLNWQDLTDQFVHPDVSDIKRGKSGLLYAKSCRFDAYEVSSDEGQSWSPLLFFDSSGITLRNLAIRSDGLLLGIANNVGSKDRGYRSSDNGNSWQRLDLPTSGLGSFPEDVILADYSGGFYYINGNSLQKTLDGGDTWELVGFGNFDYAQPAFLPNGAYFIASGSELLHYYDISSNPDFVLINGDEYLDPSNVYATQAGTVFFSVNSPFIANGLYRIEQGSAEPELSLSNAKGPMASDPAGHVFIASDGHLYGSIDNGTNWSLIADLPGKGTLQVLYWANDHRLYAGFDDDVIYRSQELLTGIGDPITCPSALVMAHPNPFRAALTFEIRGLQETGELLSLRLFDAQGRLMRRETFRGNTFTLPRSGLEKGLYFYLIEMQGKQLAAGKVVAE